MAWTNDLILCRAGLGMRLYRGRRLHWLRVQCDYSCRLAGCPVVAHRVVAGGNRHIAGRSLTQKEVTNRAGPPNHWRASTRFPLDPSRPAAPGPQYGASYPAEPVVTHQSILGSVLPAGGTIHRCAAGASPS